MRSTLNMQKSGRGRSIILTLLIACLLMPFSPAVYADDDFQEEIKIGKEAADEVAKESKFIDDPAMVARVETIGSAIAKVAVEKEVAATYGKSTLAKFDYSFKIIDDKDVNAFSLPGGYVYVNKGLLDYVQSDDELAGVIAHEIVHASHHHAMQLIKAQQKQMFGMAAAIIFGAALGGGGRELGNLAYAVNLIAIAKMSSYGQKAEFDADRTAVAYLVDTKYNPVGMLTFMERLARDEIRKPETNYGIFATHPQSNLRAREIISEIDKRGIPINRRMVTKYMRVEVKPIDESKAVSIWVSDTEIVRLADSGGERAAARAERVADMLGNLLLAGARLQDIKVGGGGQYVVVMGKVLLAPTDEDAALAGKSVAEVVTSTANALRKALLKELLDQGY